MIEAGMDPYAAWLQIEEPARPLNAYQLLGLAEFEANPAKIRAGFERRMRSLDLAVDSADSRQWTALRDELRQALSQLSDSGLRAELNAAVRRRRASLSGRGAAEASADAAIACANCQTANRAKRRYCSQCGDPLWRLCGKCGSERPVDEVYCGACGVHSQRAEEELHGACELRLDAARRLAEQCQYAAAFRELHQVLLLEDPRLEDEIRQAAALRAELRGREAEDTRAATAREAAAHELAQQGRFEKVIALVEQIPLELRSDDVTRLLADARARFDHLRRLMGEIKSRLDARRCDGLAPLIDQVLELDARRESIRKIALKLRGRWLPEAMKRLEQAQFERAAECLDAIPGAVSDREVERLRGQAEDRLAIWTRLERSTVVDPVLVKLGIKLAEQTSHHETVVKLVADARSHLEKGGPPIAPWRSPQPSARLGCDVEWQGGTRGLPAADDEVRTALAAAPSQWFVASGLAIQALGEGRCRLNLAAEPSSKGLGGLFKRTKKAEAFWGIDLGAASLKAIRLERDSSGRPLITGARRIPLGDGDPRAARGRALRQLSQEFSFESAQLCASLASHLVQVRYVSLPPVPPKKLAVVVEQERQRLFPSAAAELVVRQEILEREGDPRAGEAGVREAGALALFLAARLQGLQSAAADFEAAEIPPPLLTSEALALWNWRHFEATDFAADAPCWALLDIGAAEARLLVMQRQQFLVRSLSSGGNSVTNSLCSELNLTLEQAERLKRDHSLARHPALFYEVARQSAEKLIREIEWTFDSYEHEHKVRPQRLLVVGGGSLMSGLIDALRAGR